MGYSNSLLLITHCLAIAFLWVDVQSLEQCKIYFTFPVNWNTVKSGIANSHPRPFTTETKNGMCSQYKGNACCSSGFVNNFVYEYFKDSVDELETPRCRAAITHFECFACGLNQFDYMVVDDDAEKAEIKICRKTCETLFEDCKDDPGFKSKDGMRPSNANQVCDVIDRLDDEDIEVKILESLEKCYLYDDSGPKVLSTFPLTGDHGVSAATEDFKLVLSEPVTIGNKGKITLYDSTGKVVAALDVSRDSQDIRFVTTHSRDDTIEFRFSNNKESKNCILKAQEMRYFIDVDKGAFVDRANNSFVGLHGRAWEFQTDRRDECPYRHSVDVPLIVGLSVLGIFLLSVVGFIVLYYRRRMRETQRRYTSVDDTLSLNVFSGEGIIPDVDGKI